MDKSVLSFERLQTFVRIAERGNLSAVAKELSIGQSTVSRHLAELEAALGVSLLSRTTRRIALTDEGSRYYSSALAILRLMEAAHEEVLSARDAPKGTVRISCTAAFGVLHITPLVMAFQEQYPDIAIDLNLTDEHVDLVREGIDIAIRLGHLSDSNMKLKPLGNSERILVASSDYLSKHGIPQTPDELAHHEAVRMSNVAGSRFLNLTDRQGANHTVPLSGRLTVDHGLAARATLIADRGLLVAHRWLVDDLLASGQVVHILTEYTLSPSPLSLLIVPERSNIARVRLLIAFLAKEISAIPGLH